MVYIGHLGRGRGIWSRLNFDKTFIVFNSTVINKRLFNVKLANKTPNRYQRRLNLSLASVLIACHEHDHN